MAGDDPPGTAGTRYRGSRRQTRGLSATCVTTVRGGPARYGPRAFEPDDYTSGEDIDGDGEECLMIHAVIITLTAA